MPNLTTINTFSAAYLLLMLGILFLVFAMIWHKGYFFWISMICWVFFGSYLFSIAHEDATIIMLGTLCFLVALICIVLVVALRPKKEVPPEETPEQKHARWLAEIRRLRYGNNPEYDNDGNYKSGW